jgi:CHAD domain-containing protein
VAATATVALEIEQKFDVPGGFVLPEPGALRATLATEAVEIRDDGQVRLAATYYDTADLRLARDKITLRRRTGGKDAGWHLKLPGKDDGRQEVTAPLGRAGQVPEELFDLVQAVVRDAPLHPAAVLRTRRRVLTVVSATGQPLAEIVDDEVTASRSTPPAGDGEAAADQVWRELEVELLEGDRALLADVAQALVTAGARPSDSPSKLARALGPIGPPPVAEPATAVPLKAPIGRAVEAYAREHVRALIAQDRRVRQDLPDSVHKMRVAARRLRSTLRTFGPVLDPAVVDALEPELRWLGAVLGEARDREVLLDRLRGDLRQLPAELVLGNVAARLEQTLLPELLDAVATAKDELRGERYLRLLDALVAFAANVPVTSTRPVGKVAPQLGRRAWRKVARRMAVAGSGAALQLAPDDALHSVRKAAKQARYAGEALTIVYGSEAADFAAAMESMQELLGEHQDSTVSRQLLRRLGAGNRNGFTFGVMYGGEAERAHQARAQLPAVWERASAKRLRRWMSSS